MDGAGWRVVLGGAAREAPATSRTRAEGQDGPQRAERRARTARSEPAARTLRVVVTCSSCGAQAGAGATSDDGACEPADAAPDVPLGWMVEHDRTRGRTFVCPAC